jgi:hypothetical protein
MFQLKIKDKKGFVFIIAAFIFLLVESSMYILDYLYTYGAIFGMISIILFFSYAFYYLHDKDSKTKGKHTKIFYIIFALILLNFILIFVFSGLASNAVLSYESSTLYAIVVNAIFIAVIGTVFFIGAYLVRSKKNKKSTRFGYFLMGIAVVLIFAYFLSGLAIKYYKIDDEFFIAVKEVGYLLHGTNPYQQSLAQELYYNSSSTGFSLTTNNQIIGILNYPALYLFSYLPFYPIAPTIYNIEHYIAPIQSAVFFTLLLFTIALVIDKKSLKSPLLPLFLFLAFFSVNIASLTSYLMLALLVLAYAKTGTKYSWLLFGLCIAMQELLWVPILLLILYTFKNYGYKKGVYDILGALVVFLILNSYFIALSPAAFSNALFNPIQKLLIPSGDSPVSFLLISNYGMLLNGYTLIFGISIISVALMYFYLNQKVLIALFSMVPIFLLAHTLSAYFTFFTTFLIITMLIPEQKTKANAKVKSKYGLPALAIAVVLLIILVYVVYNSHIQYSNQFDIHTSNQSLYYNPALNETIYQSKLSYTNVSQNNLYIMFFAYTKAGFVMLGIKNYSIINAPASCSANELDCMLNVNVIHLNGSTGSYEINAHLGNYSTLGQVKDVRLVIYSGKYFYVADAVQSK